MEEKPRILFICQHNSGRSQMAAAYLRHFAGNRLHDFPFLAMLGEKVEPRGQTALSSRTIRTINTAEA